MERPKQVQLYRQQVGCQQTIFNQLTVLIRHLIGITVLRRLTVLELFTLSCLVPALSGQVLRRKLQFQELMVMHQSGLETSQGIFTQVFTLFNQIGVELQDSPKTVISYMVPITHEVSFGTVGILTTAMVFFHPQTINMLTLQLHTSHTLQDVGDLRQHVNILFYAVITLATQAYMEDQPVPWQEYKRSAELLRLHLL